MLCIFIILFDAAFSDAVTGATIISLFGEGFIMVEKKREVVVVRNGEIQYGNNLKKCSAIVMPFL